MLSHASPGLLFAVTLCCILVYGQVDVPSPNNFIRRNWHSVTALGDFAYIDGGRVAQYVYMYSTLSIPLNESWTPATLSFQVSKKDSLVPKAQGAALWADADTKALITFGGDFWGEDDEISAESRNTIWAFITDGSGGGMWENPAAAGASGIARRAYGSSVVCAGTALQLGGYSSIFTDSAYNGEYPVPGLVPYNLSASSSLGSGSWSNTSDTAFVGNYVYGDAVCLPSYGQASLAVFIGGSSARIEDLSIGDSVSLANLTFYDPQSGQWYWQMTSGQVPQARQQSCVVAVEGPKGTTEIFVYGGYDHSLSTSFSDLWVLTIPGFQWFQGDTSGGGTQRVGHQCVVGGQGNRQMISIGGINRNASADTGFWDSVDPWTNGVGVLDLPNMTWTNTYHATAAASDSPQVVQDWYSSGNLKSVAWSSDEVKSVFLSKYTTHSTTPTTTATPNTATPTSLNSSLGQNNGKTNTGAIAGGVVGGVAAVAMAVALAYYLMRIRRRQRPKGGAPDAEYRYGKAEHSNELPAYSSPGELPAHSLPGELPAHSPPRELPGQLNHHELDTKTSTYPAEMP